MSTFFPASRELKAIKGEAKASIGAASVIGLQASKRRCYCYWHHCRYVITNKSKLIKHVVAISFGIYRCTFI
tara:strand:+ start:606 stop:821 length:216 start_codon:yes stop_codon:yes gene_type:complete